MNWLRYENCFLSCKIAEARIDVNSLVDELRRRTFESYASKRHNDDPPLKKVYKCPKGMLVCKATALQKSVKDEICGVVGGLHQSFFSLSEVIDRNLSFIAVHTKRDESAKPKTYLRIVQIMGLVVAGKELLSIARVFLGATGTGACHLLF